VATENMKRQRLSHPTGIKRLKSKTLVQRSGELYAWAARRTGSNIDLTTSPLVAKTNLNTRRGGWQRTRKHYAQVEKVGGE